MAGTPTTAGRKTSEFLVTVGTIGAQAAGAILAGIASIEGSIPHAWAGAVAIAVVLVTALQAAAYTLSRTNVKVAQANAGTPADTTEVGVPGTVAGDNSDPVA